MLKIKLSIIFALFLSSCSTGKYEFYRKQLLANLKNGNYENAENIVNNKDFYKGEDFLKNVEKGTIHYLNKDYYQSVLYLEKAKKICDDETIKISSKIKEIWNNTSDYYCERYERSMLNFYLSLAHYNLYYYGKYENYISEDKNGNEIVIKEKQLNEKERLFHLQASRSFVIQWDSLLSNYKKEIDGRSSAYKDDILARIWGATIHEQFDNSENKQIALQLYKDTKDILLKNYNVYPTFNKKSEIFKKEYSKFYKTDLNFIKANYIEKTDYSNELLNFLDNKIEKLSNNEKDNLIVILKNNFVVEKQAKKIKVGIPINRFIANNLIIVDSSGGGEDFMSFAIMALGFIVDGEPAAELELPYMEERKNKDNFTVVVFDKNNNKITDFSLVMTNPNSDIAYKELNDKINYIYSKITINFALKHATALISAYSIYKQNPSPAMLLAAILSYKAAAKIINNTSKADLRQWISLSDNVRIGSALLKKGDYTIEIYKNNFKINTKNITVNNNQVLIDLNI